MLMMIAIAWVVVLPVLVVAGLSLGSRVLGARARRSGGAIDVTRLARDVAHLVDDADGRRAASAGPVPGRPVGARY